LSLSCQLRKVTSFSINQFEGFLAKKTDLQQVNVTEQLFRFQFNEDAMATEKLAEGIRKFAADARLLEELVDKEI
jgi:transaldolase